MNKWLCIKDGKVVNIVVAEAAFMEKDPEIANLYDSYIDKNLAPALDGQDLGIGAELIDGKWGIPFKLVDVDFSGLDISGMNFRYSDLTGSKFVGTTITNSNFRNVSGDFTLAQAVWDGKTIQHGPVWISNNYYYCMLTDVFTVMGCQNLLTAKVPSMNAVEVSNSDKGQPSKPAEFWQDIMGEYISYLQAWGVVF